VMQKINKEDDTYHKSSFKEPQYMVHDEQTCLLLFQIIEICARRIGEASSVINRNSDRFIQLSCSVCDNINQKVLLSHQVTN
jgi:ent-copalyl diphosphate synthase